MWPLDELYSWLFHSKEKRKKREQDAIALVATEDWIQDQIVNHTKLNEASEIGMLSLFTGLFADFRDETKASPTKYVFFLALLIEAIFFYTQAKLFIKAENKTLQKTLNLIMTGVAFGVVTAAVIFGVIGVVALAAIIPYLFCALMAFRTAFHLGAAAYFGYKWYRASKAGADRIHEAALYRAKCLGNLKAGIITGTAAIVVGCVLTFAPHVAPIVQIGIESTGAGLLGTLAVDSFLKRAAPSVRAFIHKYTGFNWISRKLKNAIGLQDDETLKLARAGEKLTLEEMREPSATAETAVTTAAKIVAALETFATIAATGGYALLNPYIIQAQSAFNCAQAASNIITQNSNPDTVNESLLEAKTAAANAVSIAQEALAASQKWIKKSNASGEAEVNDQILSLKTDIAKLSLREASAIKLSPLSSAPATSGAPLSRQDLTAQMSYFSADLHNRLVKINPPQNGDLAASIDGHRRQIINLIIAKLDQLHEEFKQNGFKANFQKTKRLAKINALRMLQELLTTGTTVKCHATIPPTSSEQFTTNADENKISTLQELQNYLMTEENGYKGNVFQSYFQATDEGEVQKIFGAAWRLHRRIMDSGLYTAKIDEATQTIKFNMNAATA